MLDLALPDGWLGAAVFGLWAVAATVGWAAVAVVSIQEWWRATWRTTS